MPQVLNESSNRFGDLVLWKIEEELPFFEQMIKIPSAQLIEMENWKIGRRREWCASRYLIKNILHTDVDGLYIDEHGKPHITSKEYEISLSHSRDFIALGWHYECSIGIDIQWKNPKVSRVAHKFCTDRELAKFPKDSSTEEREHFIWSVKESIYKAYGKRNLSFKNNIIIDQIMLDAYGYRISAFISKKDQTLHFDLNAREMNGLFIVKCVAV